MWRPAVRTHTILCVVLWGATGCYAYLDTPRASLVPGHEVRLTLADDDANVLRAQLGPRAESLTGRLIGDSAGSMLLHATAVTYRSGETTSWQSEHVAIPQGLIIGTGDRRFSGGRTALLAGAIGAAAFAARHFFSGTNDGTNISSAIPRTGGQ